MNKLVNQIVKNKKPCYFISPHLDDAALSCGGLIEELARKTDVTIITVFTEARDGFYTLSAKKAVMDSGYPNAHALYEDRKAEDREAFKELAVQIMHMDEVESLYRLHPQPSFLQKILSRVLPEFIHTYPTYKFHIAKGGVMPSDSLLIKRLAKRLKEIIPEDSIVFAPYGVGGHADHLVVREATEAVFKPILWLDQPYLERETSNSDTRVVPEGFEEHSVNQKTKKKCVNAYKTQVSLLFSGSKTPDLPEYYRTS